MNNNDLNDLVKTQLDEEIIDDENKLDEIVSMENILSSDSDEDTEEFEIGYDDYGNMSREKLLEKFKEYLANYSLPASKQHLEAIKEAFENIKSEEEEEIDKHYFLDSGVVSDLPLDPLQKKFSELLQEYRSKKDHEREQIEEEKERNLKAKYEVIESIKDLINRQESLNNTFQEFRELQHRWREIGPVPQTKLHDLWETFNLHVENFYNYIKINNELRDLDLKKNYEAKINLCEKTEKLLLEPSTPATFNMLQKYHNQWREIGPAPKDKQEEIWERFKAASAAINQKRSEYINSIREQQRKNYEAKCELCEKVEALVNEEIVSPKKWKARSSQLIEYQNIWKTIGFGPRKENNQIYSRFRKACNKFFRKKRDFFNALQEELLNNVQLKTELCIQAEALKDSTDWRKTTDEFIKIQKKWKEIGQVPIRQADALWKRFSLACEYFFEQKHSHFNQIDKELEINQKKKIELIEKVKNYKVSQDGEKSFNELQDFQRNWAQIGHTPIKDREKLANEFRSLINKQFDKLNLDEGNINFQKFKSKLENWKVTKQFNEKIGLERIKIIQKLKQLETDIVIWENNIGFFIKSKNSDALVRDFTNKINIGKENIKLLNDKLNFIDTML